MSIPKTLIYFGIAIVKKEHKFHTNEAERPRHLKSQNSHCCNVATGWEGCLINGALGDPVSGQS